MLQKISLLLSLVLFFPALFGMDAQEIPKKIEQEHSSAQMVADPNSALTQAVVDNNLAAAKKAIAGGAEVSKCRVSGNNGITYSLLNSAIQSKANTALIQLLIELEQNLEEKRQAFLNCAWSGNLPACEVFVQNKRLIGGVNWQLRGALTALNCFCRPQVTQAVATNHALRLLEEDDVEVNQKGDSRGYYPAHCCILSKENPHLMHGNVLLRKLLEKGADLSLKDNIGHTPFRLAISETPQYVPLLLALGATSRRILRYITDHSVFIIEQYIASEAHAVLRMLFRSLAVYNGRLSEELSKSEKFLIHLIYGSAYWNGTDSDLTLAFIENEMRTHQIDINMQLDLSPEAFIMPSKTERTVHVSTIPLNLTPLMWAAALNNTSLIQVLLQIKQTDVNRQDAQGNTALHWAVQNGHYEAVATLLDHPSTGWIKNNAGQNPRMLAQSRLKAWQKHPTIRGIGTQNEKTYALDQLERRKLVHDLFDVLTAKRVFTFLECRHAEPVRSDDGVVITLPPEICMHIASFIRLNDGECQPARDYTAQAAAAAQMPMPNSSETRQDDSLNQL